MFFVNLMFCFTCAQCSSCGMPGSSSPQHDPATTRCSPGAPSGNYIMYAHATSGTDPNNRLFSPCSIAAISSVVQAKAPSCFERKNNPVRFLSRVFGPAENREMCPPPEFCVFVLLTIALTFTFLKSPNTRPSTATK